MQLVSSLMSYDDMKIVGDRKTKVGAPEVGAAVSNKIICTAHHSHVREGHAFGSPLCIYIIVMENQPVCHIRP